jgi:uncharacterized membrane protein YfcA
VSGGWLVLLLFPLLGAVSGLLAGLFGIGGGLVVVPLLNLYFADAGLGIPADSRMHFAIGTSLGVIVFTALASLRAHHGRGAVVWTAVRRLVPGIVVGGLLGAALAAAMDNRMLQTTFGVLVLVIALHIALDYRPPGRRPLPGWPGFLGAGVGIGAISALGGIGGGVMTVPFLLWRSTPIRRAVGTAAACTLPVAVAGTTGFVVAGWGLPDPPALATGYVFWPAVAGIAIGSVPAAPLGARLAHSLPVHRLRQGFAILLTVVGVRMIWRA